MQTIQESRSRALSQRKMLSPDMITKILRAIGVAWMNLSRDVSLGLYRRAMTPATICAHKIIFLNHDELIIEQFFHPTNATESHYQQEETVLSTN
jgi:hypothetical protein